MFVRVYDKLKREYYKSMVYGLINTGYYEQAITYNPFSGCFELVDYFDKGRKNLSPAYQHINSNRDEWITVEKTSLLKLKKYCRVNGSGLEITCFNGYQEVFDDFGFLLRIIREKNVPAAETKLAPRDNEDISQWNYIRTQADANQFMKLFVAFHDSTLDKLNYEETYGETRLTVQFDNSGWYGIVELCFEGIIALNLRAPLENYSREIYGATLLIRDESVFWADDELEVEDLSYPGTYIKALNLKWRKIS